MGSASFMLWVLALVNYWTQKYFQVVRALGGRYKTLCTVFLQIPALGGLYFLGGKLKSHIKDSDHLVSGLGPFTGV
jgi:hypothetical protein